jgi:magnesium-transporting ATPase (P-type)
MTTNGNKYDFEASRKEVERQRMYNKQDEAWQRRKFWMWLSIGIVTIVSLTVTGILIALNSLP